MKKLNARKVVTLIATGAAALSASLVIAATPATADGSIIVNIGPGQYNGTFTHPTGTLSVGGGTISARCAAKSFKGSSVFLTPKCTTRVTTCPATATSCSVVANLQEGAARGPVLIGGSISFTGGSYTSVTVLQPYNCPKANACGTRVRFNGVAPGTSVQLAGFNAFYNPNLPGMFAQTSMTVH